MKKKYTDPTFDVFAVEAKDVITVSGGLEIIAEFDQDQMPEALSMQDFFG